MIDLWKDTSMSVDDTRMSIHDTSTRIDDERGDVPGWVLVTLMTAGLVVAIWALAGPALSGLFEQAISRVSGL